ncbi:HoxN/HupN/NixA family nickel/cobalt transporter [Alkalihalobacillus deserti]|uniref:HoxN/HupN/NixA family nickel/cobalt transporter n=1 Tax=Alkalihalobacillus deserti TaxID=2879466 RepID=UPI001D146029|nr:High-affinity nickel-transporter [Alkalihalobacillus deserti]
MELLTFGLLAILIGIRHGMDADHVAALADMIGTETQKTKQYSLGIMYAVGHGLIVLIIGLLALYVGVRLPEGAYGFLEMLVSFTLILLGAIILYSLFNNKGEYEYKSRIAIVYGFLEKVFRGKDGNEISATPLTLGIIGALIIGLIHGIGVESPTQIAIISNAVGLDNVTAAALHLILFVFGLLISTISLTFILSWGFFKARVKKVVYVLLGSITGVYSVSLGVFMILEFI